MAAGWAAAPAVAAAEAVAAEAVARLREQREVRCGRGEHVGSAYTSTSSAGLQAHALVASSASSRCGCRIRACCAPRRQRRVCPTWCSRSAGSCGAGCPSSTAAAARVLGSGARIGQRRGAASGRRPGALGEPPVWPATGMQAGARVHWRAQPAPSSTRCGAASKHMATRPGQLTWGIPLRAMPRSLPRRKGSRGRRRGAVSARPARLPAWNPATGLKHRTVHARSAGARPTERWVPASLALNPPGWETARCQAAPTMPSHRSHPRSLARSLGDRVPDDPGQVVIQPGRSTTPQVALPPARPSLRDPAPVLPQPDHLPASSRLRASHAAGSLDDRVLHLGQVGVQLLPQARHRRRLLARHLARQPGAVGGVGHALAPLQGRQSGRGGRGGRFGAVGPKRRLPAGTAVAGQGAACSASSAAQRGAPRL